MYPKFYYDCCLKKQKKTNTTMLRLPALEASQSRTILETYCSFLVAQSLGNHALQVLGSEDHETHMLPVQKRFAQLEVGGHPTRKGSAYSTRVFLRVVADNDLNSRLQGLSVPFVPHKFWPGQGVWSTCENFPFIQFDRHAKFGRCFTYGVRVCRRSHKKWETPSCCRSG